MPNDAFAKNSNEYRSMLLYGGIAFALAIFIRVFVAAPYLVQGSSMDPSFYTNDYLIIDRLSYRLDEPQRGDVIVFRYPQDPSRSFIKRVIGLPGETVDISGDTVRIKNGANPEGFTLTEPYIAAENKGGNDAHATVGPDQFFVLGDNRKASADSRIWGLLPRENIIGRALARLYPFTEIDINPGAASYNNQ